MLNLLIRLHARWDRWWCIYLERHAPRALKGAVLLSEGMLVGSAKMAEICDHCQTVRIWSPDGGASITFRVKPIRWPAA